MGCSTGCEDLRHYGLPNPIEDQGADYGLPPRTRNRLAYRMGLSAGIAAALRATGVTPYDEQASGNWGCVAGRTD